MQRRQFLKRAVQSGAAVSFTAMSYANVAGANEKVRVALVGCGNRGTAVSRLMSAVPDTEFVAACDVYDINAGKAKERFGSGCETFRDFRKVLDRRDVDALLVATPDHWHATVAVLACRAGKDVYVEKPLAHNIKEGRAIVDAARKHNRVVQAGMQHRSSEHYRQAQQIVQNGDLGPVRFVHVWNYVNLYPDGMGKVANSEAPPELDWDFYLGPAPEVPFNQNRFLQKFRSFWDYAGGFLTDFGAHRLDSVHQVMGADAPRTITAVGGRFELHDGGETPDVLQVTYEYPNFVLSYDCCQINGNGNGGRTPGKKYYRARGPDDRPHGEAFYGANGTLMSDRIGYEIYPEFERERERQPGSGPPDNRPADDNQPARGALKARMKRQDVAAEDRTDLHTKNFIECVRSRERPVADVEIAHRSTIAVHLGNIAFRTGRKIHWDSEKEEIVDDPAASMLLGRQARKQWDLI
jgi:predicted dehydrogenase